MQFNMSTYNNEEGIWYGAITGVAAGNGNQNTSNFFGVGLDGTSKFGKYGMACYTYAFEVIKDCDLSEVFTFDRDDFGTEIHYLICKIRICILLQVTIQQEPLLTGH